jgi:hypothetical protein
MMRFWFLKIHINLRLKRERPDEEQSTRETSERS